MSAIAPMLDAVAAQEKTYTVKEVFGPTKQGEGPMIGRQTVFLRFHLCDGDGHGHWCSWCDTKETWDKSHPLFDKHEKLTAAQIVERITSLYQAKYPDEPMYEMMPWVTISGGNPMVQLDRNLLDALNQAGFQIQIETQGTIFKPELLSLVEYVVVSPKPPSSGMLSLNATAMTNWASLSSHGTKIAYKFVVFDDADFEWAAEQYALIKEHRPSTDIYLQAGTPVPNEAELTERAAAGDTAGDWVAIHNMADSYRWLVEKWLNCGKMRDAIVLPQLHVLVWGRRKGV